MTIPKKALSRAGQILYRELPEEYRYRDNNSEDEPGDLEAYLHGFGHMLDLIRATTEQAYADGFAEETGTGHEIQPWLLPYLAELVGAELLAPDEKRRREELNNSVLWSKSKGTLHNVDHVGDVISGAETVVREGWRLTLTCPRPGLPPFSVPMVTDPADQIGRTPMPLGCPDFRTADRPVIDPSGANPLFRLRQPIRKADGTVDKTPNEVFWKPRAEGSVPCFPGSYGDATVRCPDLRDAEHTGSPGPHPGRSLIRIRPPEGLFETGLREVELTDPGVLEIAAGKSGFVIDPAYVLEKVEGIADAPHDRIKLQLKADLTIPANSEVEFRNILITGTVGAGAAARPVRLRVGKAARLTLSSCAAETIVLPGTGAGDAAKKPVLDATYSLIGSITGPNRFARLIYCTVMGETDVARIHASDCIFDSLSSNLNCEGDASCIRYSRFTPIADTEGCFSSEAPTNTARRARFARRYLPEGEDGCALRLPRYGEPGYGVLDILAHPAISAGAEDEGEIGACHAFHYAAQVRALRKKLTAYLPLGQEIALAYDPLLALTPPRVVKADEE